MKTIRTDTGRKALIPATIGTEPSRARAAALSLASHSGKVKLVLAEAKGTLNKTERAAIFRQEHYERKIAFLDKAWGSGSDDYVSRPWRPPVYTSSARPASYNVIDYMKTITACAIALRIPLDWAQAQANVDSPLHLLTQRLPKGCHVTALMQRISREMKQTVSDQGKDIDWIDDDVSVVDSIADHSSVASGVGLDGNEDDRSLEPEEARRVHSSAPKLGDGDSMIDAAPLLDSLLRSPKPEPTWDVSGFKTNIFRAIIELERPDARLHDDTIQAVMDAIHSRLHPDRAGKVTFVSPLWFEIDGAHPEDMCRIKPDTELALIPLHHRHPVEHWTCVAVQLKERVICHYDSAPGFSRRTKVSKTLEGFFTEKMGFPFTVTEKECQGQSDNIQCGVFVLCVLRQLADGKSVTTINAEAERKAFAALLRSGEVVRPVSVVSSTEPEINCLLHLSSNIATRSTNKRSRNSPEPPPRERGLAGITFSGNVLPLEPLLEDPSSEHGNEPLLGLGEDLEDVPPSSPHDSLLPTCENDDGPDVTTGDPQSSFVESPNDTAWTQLLVQLKTFVPPGVDSIPPDQLHQQLQDLRQRHGELTAQVENQETNCDQLKAFAAKADTKLTEYRRLYKESDAWLQNCISTVPAFVNAPRDSIPSHAFDTSPLQATEAALVMLRMTSASSLSQLQTLEKEAEHATGAATAAKEANDQCLAQLAEVEKALVEKKKMLNIARRRQELMQTIGLAGC